MFDLIVSGHRQTPHGDTAPIMVSVGLHSVAAMALVIVPLMFMTDSMPQVPTMMAFVAAAPTPPPPPPPPAPRVKAETRAPQPASPMRPPSGAMSAPIEVPTALPVNEGTDDEDAVGVPGGVEGGVPGGVVAGVVADVPSPPLPPPPPPEPVAPVRIGGELRPPALLSRVEPNYPEFAVRARVEGVVILEAVVGVDGGVEDVRILRPIQLLNQAAIDAVRQWRYAPLLLNGNPVRFILTVTVAFHITEKS